MNSQKPRANSTGMSSIAENCTEHSLIWGMFMATTLIAATFMGKFFNHAECCEESRKSFIENRCLTSQHKWSTMRKKFLVLDKIVYQKNSWTQLSLITDSVIIYLQSTNVLRIFRFCVVSRQSSSTS